MLFIEFETKINYGSNNILKYRDIDDDNWFYLYIDIEILNLLIRNFGIISTIKIKIKTKFTNVDNPSTGKEINLKYCDSNIKLYCKNNTKFYIPFIEQNY